MDAQAVTCLNEKNMKYVCASIAKPLINGRHMTFHHVYGKASECELLGGSSAVAIIVASNPYFARFS